MKEEHGYEEKLARDEKRRETYFSRREAILPLIAEVVERLEQAGLDDSEMVPYHYALYDENQADLMFMRHGVKVLFKGNVRLPTPSTTYFTTLTYIVRRDQTTKEDLDEIARDILLELKFTPYGVEKRRRQHQKEIRTKLKKRAAKT